MLHAHQSVSSLDGNVTELAAAARSSTGQRTEVALVYSVVRSPEMAPLNAVVNVRDMTRVRETEEMRSTFLSMLEHQLQTPLAIIKGYTNTLSRPDAQWDGETLHRSFEAIEEETDRMSQLMDRLLLASRLEAGALPLSLEQVNMAGVAAKVIERLQSTSKKHSLFASFPDDLPPVTGDPGLLEQVLVNLVDNAVKYSPDGGPVVVSGEQDSHGGVRVTVSDAGMGVPRWETRRIFERFHRSQNRASTHPRGMGLGLYICDAIMKAHHGDIWVTSDPGEGSTFTIMLPNGTGAPP